jgi:sec-independent protein translocase protein TatA
MANVGPMEIVLLLGLALLLFGAKRLPEIGRSLGSGMREFKESVSGETPREARSELPPTTAATLPAPAPDAAPVRAAAEDASPAPSAERENQPSAAASG